MTRPTARGSRQVSDALDRIAAALERLAPAPMPAPDFAAEAFVWHTGPDRLEPVAGCRGWTCRC
jgi:hypothetical protein